MGLDCLSAKPKLSFGYRASREVVTSLGDPKPGSLLGFKEDHS